MIRGSVWATLIDSSHDSSDDLARFCAGYVSGETGKARLTFGMLAPSAQQVVPDEVSLLLEARELPEQVVAVFPTRAHAGHSSWAEREP